jgi:predicted NodU family carbamoyl transferase
MTELKPFVKRTVLHRNGGLVAAVEEERFLWAKEGCFSASQP